MYYVGVHTEKVVQHHQVDGPAADAQKAGHRPQRQSYDNADGKILNAPGILSREEATVMLIFFLVALTASIAGAICGIGGGVIIKPVLDLLHLETVAAISFLSGCTVLSMSCYSVGKSLLAKERSVSLKRCWPSGPQEKRSA